MLIGQYEQNRQLQCMERCQFMHSFQVCIIFSFATLTILLWGLSLKSYWETRGDPFPNKNRFCLVYGLFTFLYGLNAIQHKVAMTACDKICPH